MNERVVTLVSSKHKTNFFQRASCHPPGGVGGGEVLTKGKNLNYITEVLVFLRKTYLYEDGSLDHTSICKLRTPL